MTDAECPGASGPSVCQCPKGKSGADCTTSKRCYIIIVGIVIIVIMLMPILFFYLFLCFLCCTCYNSLAKVLHTYAHRTPRSAADTRNPSWGGGGKRRELSCKTFERPEVGPTHTLAGNMATKCPSGKWSPTHN